MKQTDIKPCAICGNGMMHLGIPIFYTIKIQRHGLEAGAIQRQSGLEQFFGGHALLANVMGANEDMSKPLTDESELWVCDHCANENLLPLIAAIQEPETEGEFVSKVKKLGE